MTMDEKDFQTPFSYVVDTTKFYSLNPSCVKLLRTLQLWYMSQPSPSLTTWFTLNAADNYQPAKNAQRLVPPAASPPAAVPPPINNFCSAIKINLNDYVKFKEDSQ
jgi:hypothetical protein